MPRWFAGLAGLLLLARLAPAQLPPDKALATMQPGDGLQVGLFAHEPMLINPTSIDIDHLGRVWVCEAVNYRCFLRNKPLNRAEGDRIVILTDTDGDGKADESKVFYQGKELIAPLGIAVVPLASRDRKGAASAAPCKVFVCQSPDILLFHDKDGDGKADGPPEKFLSGFGGFDHDHGVHGINVGPDGKLYFTVGDQGVNDLQSKDGKGRKWVTTRDPKGDCQAGTVWRCDMDGTNLELIAHNFRNNYECCVDSFGEVWLSDNDDDGNQQTRICFVMPGGNYGYWPRGPGQTHWHEEQPGVVHKALRTGFGSPTGICFYEGSLLPVPFRGNLLHTDAGPRELRCFVRKPKGAGYELDKVPMLTSSDNWFRPSDVCVAPDGSVFVADWYDPGVGGHGMGDTTRGRIYRLTPKGHAGYKVPKVELDTLAAAVDAMSSPCLATRAIAFPAARRALRAGQPEGAGPVSLKGDQVLMARMQWVVVESIDPSDREGLIKSFTQRDNLPDVLYPQVVRIMGQNSYPAKFTEGEASADLVALTSAAILREYAVFARNLDAEPAKRLFYILANKYDGHDHFYRAALNIACGTDPARRDAILADFDKHFPEWNDTVADLVWELRPKSVLPRLEKLLAGGKLTAAQKGRIVDILAASDDPAAGKTVLALLKADQPAAVKARALDNLRLFLPTKWNALARADDLKAAVGHLLADDKAKPTGLQLVAAANYTPAIDEVAAIAADAGRPMELRVQAVRTLGQLRHVKAVEALRDIGQPENPLSVECVRALGRHLPNGGPQKASEAGERALDALQTAVTLPKAGRELRLAALTALAGSRAGTGWLLALKEKNQFPADLLADAGRLLRNSPFQGERNKALILFPAAVKLDPKKLPSIAELAKRRGDAANGQRLMAASLTGDMQCLKCHTVNKQGGQIGPDLSLIGKKGSRENLFESILLPSKAIADQFVSWKIDTADGQSITGLLVQETPAAVTLRDANGKDYAIPVKDIEKRSKSQLSLMPEGLVGTMTEDELVDLVEYMTTLQGPDPAGK